jgi:hypothetical protein
LAASDQKAAPAKVNRILRLRWLSQTHDLRIFSWNRNLTAAPWPVKVELEILHWRGRPHVDLARRDFAAVPSSKIERIYNDRFPTEKPDHLWEPNIQ